MRVSSCTHPGGSYIHNSSNCHLLDSRWPSCVCPIHFMCTTLPFCLLLCQRSLSPESKELLTLFKRLCVSHSALVLMGHMDGEEEEAQG